MEKVTLAKKISWTKNEKLNWVITICCAAVGAIYLYTSYFGQFMVFQQRGIILAVCYLLVFLKYPMFKGKSRNPFTVAIDIALSLLTVLIVYEFAKIEYTSEPGMYYVPTNYVIFLCGALIVITIEVTRRSIGLILPLVVAPFLLYAVFGHYVPGLFRHSPIDLSSIVYYLSMTSEGIYGLPMYVTSTVIVVFLIFAGLLKRGGLVDFFMDLSTGLVGHYRGGPAKTAVISSGFMATMSGSSVANVVSTGSFTIPLMKNIGYRPSFAGAIEACASTGGVVTPPIMGAAAFIIAEYIQTSYWQVCVSAFFPALLYYFGVYMGLDLEAMKAGIKGMNKETLPKISKVLLAKGYMLIPLIVLIYYIAIVKSSPMLACFWAIVAVLIVSQIKKGTRIGPRKLIDAFADGINTSIPVVTACASAGIIIGVLTVTGLGTKLSFILVALAGNSILLLLPICAIACIILGMGITTTAIYLLMAMLVAPAIVKLGVEPLAAHLFVFFYGNLSNITPPVCIAAFAAASIADAHPMRTGKESVKLGLVLFIIPFFFCFNPALIFIGSAKSIVISMVSALIGVIVLSFCIFNYSWWGRIPLLTRVIFGISGIAMIYPNAIISLSGIGLAVVGLAFALYRKQKGVIPVKNQSGVQTL